jgi:hypothetical protein
VSQEPSPNQSGGVPRGLVWAAVLFGIAAVIGAMAMFMLVAQYFMFGPVGGGTQVAVGEPSAPPAVEQPATPAGPEAPAAPGTATHTPFPSPHSGPAPGGDGSSEAGVARVVEDWSGYADAAAMAAAFEENVGWAPGTDIVLTPLGAADSPGGPAGVAMAYDIKAEAPNDYVGVERDLMPAQDWRDYDRLVVWVRTNDRSDRQLVLQFHEWSGEVWRHRLPLKDVPANGRVEIPLTADQWEWADWSDRQNKAMDLGEVTHLGLFIGHNGPGSGVVELGSLGLEQDS